MCGKVELQCLIVMALLAVSAFCAPMKEVHDEKRSVESSPIEDQSKDDDLMDLLKLVHNEAKQDNVMVHKHEMTQIQNEDGQTVQVKETEEKVLDSDSGRLIADVKQEVKQETSGNEQSEPETVVKTKVDIPSEGVHETIVQDGEGSVRSDVQEDVQPNTAGQVDDLTPTDMAEFLLVSGQFELFFTALEKLVNESKMTPSEAEDYARAVSTEYERLELMEQEGLVEDAPMMSQRGVDYPMEFPTQWSQGYPAMPAEEFMSPEERYLALVQQQQQQQLQQELLLQEEEELNPYAFLAALWEEAFEQGNEEARAIIQGLYDRANAEESEIAQSMPFAQDGEIPLAPAEQPMANEDQVPEIDQSEEAAELAALNNPQEHSQPQQQESEAIAEETQEEAKEETSDESNTEAEQVNDEDKETDKEIATPSP